MAPEAPGPEPQKAADQAKNEEETKAVKESLLTSFYSRSNGSVPSDAQAIGHIIKGSLDAGETPEVIAHPGSIAHDVITHKYPDLDTRMLLTQAIYEKYHNPAFQERYDEAYKRFESAQGHYSEFERLRAEQTAAEDVITVFNIINQHEIEAAKKAETTRTEAEKLAKIQAIKTKIEETRAILAENIAPIYLARFEELKISVPGEKENKVFGLREYGETVIPQLIELKEAEPDNAERKKSLTKAIEYFVDNINGALNKTQKEVLSKTLGIELSKMVKRAEELRDKRLTVELEPPEEKELDELTNKTARLKILVNLIQVSESLRT